MAVDPQGLWQTGTYWHLATRPDEYAAMEDGELKRVAGEIEDIIGLDISDIQTVSAKTGVGVDELLRYLVDNIPPPEGDREAPLKALIIDSWFDNYQGVVSLVRIVEGQLTKKDKIQIMSNGQTHQVDKIGVFTPKPLERKVLRAGEVGFIIAGIKEIHGAPVGDTITTAKAPADPDFYLFE